MPTAGSLQEIAREHTKIHAKGKGGNTKFTCNHCNKEFTGSQTRQLAIMIGFMIVVQIDFDWNVVKLPYCTDSLLYIV